MDKSIGKSKAVRLLSLFLILIGVMITSFFSAQNSFAQGAAKPAAGGGGGRFEFYASSGYVSLGAASAFDLSPGFNFIPIAGWTWLQLGGEITYQKLTQQGGSTKSMLVQGGPTVNMGGTSTADAVFISLGIAYRSGSSDVVIAADDNPNGMGYYFIAGKRFPLSGGWSFRPSLGVVNTGTSGMVFRPIGISYLF